MFNNIKLHAGVMKLVYIADSKSAVRKGMGVRLPPPAFNFLNKT